MVEHSSSIAATFAALGSPVRCRIVERLRRGEMRVTDLAQPFEMSLAAVSRHVRVLERAGIARRRVEGRVHWIGLDPRPLEEARRWLEADEDFWEGRLDALGRTLLERIAADSAERPAGGTLRRATRPSGRPPSG